MANLVQYYNNLNAVAGSPHRYRSSVDPNGRVFARHMMKSAPVVMIRPGRARFTKAEDLEKAFSQLLGEDQASQLFGSVDSGEGTGIYGMGGGGASGEGATSTNLYGTGIDSKFLGEIKKQIKDKKRGTVAGDTILGSNMRYFEFEPTVMNWMSTAMTLSSRLWARMNSRSDMAWTPLEANWDGFNGQNGGFFSFWADNTTSVSESASSEYGASVLQNLLNGLSSFNKEASFIFGSAAEATGEAIADTAEMAGSDTGGVTASIASAARGQAPLFPQMWKNSSFQRSYSLSFKFYSPYGHPEAIYKNVLLPFSMLLSLALPMMKSPGSFTQPFLFQMDVPGYFNCDMGMCTSFSFTKGGGEGLWSAYENLPRQIDVTMTVEDLYPTLMASGTMASLSTNVALQSFLDNLAGIPIALSKENTDLMTILKQSMANVSGKPTKWSEGVKATVQEVMNGRLFASFFK